MVTEPQVGLDSNCLSYLLGCIACPKEPTDHLAEEKIALLRVWLYTPRIFVITKTVISEVSKIKKTVLREFHESFILTHSQDEPVHNRDAIEARVEQLKKKHKKPNDCRILAEAEDLELDFVLTYDYRFLRQLSDTSNTTKLMKPTDYWTFLDIARGTCPVTRPHDKNPLSQESWWRWEIRCEACGGFHATPKKQGRAMNTQLSRHGYPLEQA